MRHLAFLLLLAAVACAPLRQRPESRPADNDAKSLHAETVARLERFLEDGQVVSRLEGGAPEHLGDSLLWTGIAIGVTPCEQASRLMERLVERIEANNGILVRFEPLPPQFHGGNEVSFDGETGVYYGIARFVARCGGAYDLARLSKAWALREVLIDAHGGKLHPNVEQTVVPEFTTTRDQIAHIFGRRGEPHGDRLLVLEQELAAWMAAVVRTNAPCYRLNLAYLHVAALEALGRHVSDPGRAAMCTATEHADVPTWDHWCGRSDLQTYVDEFTWNHFEFRHQRCGYEGADGDQGVESPALDLLMALSILHAL